jgi:hypothetical protein
MSSMCLTYLSVSSTLGIDELALAHWAGGLLPWLSLVVGLAALLAVLALRAEHGSGERAQPRQRSGDQDVLIRRISGPKERRA